MLEIEEKLRGAWPGLTRSEQKLGAWFLSHLAEAPFETAASIAGVVGVSPMTVGRWIRKLGYANLKQIKDQLRSGASEFEWAPSGVTSRDTFAPATLKAKAAGLHRVYALAETPGWPRIVNKVAQAPRVHVASFEIGRFMGVGFAASLQNLRPKVFFSDGYDAYADVLLDPEGALLVLIDVRRYSPHFRLLAEEAAARKIPTVILTDVYCHWARALTPDVLMIETEFGIRSLSMAQLLFELLLGAVAVELGGAEQRFEAAHALRVRFHGSGDETGAGRR